MFAKVIKKKKEIVKLEGLEEDECLQLLNSHAFAGVENPSDDDHKKLRAIAGEIVKKLSRSPLAAKVIGGVLNDHLDERHWRTILESNLLDQNSIHSILRLSYIVLPNHLRNCFAFCCMFPEDHPYDKDDLVRMWIALGFIQPSSSQRETMEDIGGRYFDVLVKKALFDEVGDDYKMHDFIHESASKFFAQVCSKLVDDEVSSLKIPETLRHLFVRTTNPNILKKIEKFKHLRSLFLFYEDSNQDICSALIEMFKASRSLRLLYLLSPEADLEIIPEEIGNLMHLRYLNISDVSGYRIGELENMNDLRILGIYNLENVKDAEEACSAKLCEKRRLTNLTLEWNNTGLRNINLYEKVLDNLQPPKCLRDLEIYRYKGARSAIWMNNVNLISNLEQIILTYCLEWETLPPFGQLPFLKSLRLMYMPKVKWLVSKYNGNDKYRTFPSLEVLHITYLEALEDWFEAGVAAEDGCFFPCLIELSIDDVPRLRELPNLSPSLKRLIIRRCHPKLHKRYREDGGSDWHKIAHIPHIDIDRY
ncbi:hypothetical protein KFK09_010195 [Dendrobium nobile]|uniref:NB-ARC domain-containing protein n=1 Tax=Dendrobium nobile TaxID=94219 RepID=A0A8T3BLK1_DENNO|nr:hypothetical protein KFK09_010195 [Dendrobium nobile]